jgi:hypothetical protein
MRLAPVGDFFVLATSQSGAGHPPRHSSIPNASYARSQQC